MPRKPKLTAPAETAVGYIRVSTAEQAASGLGLDAQRAAIEAACTAHGWDLLAVHVDAGVSGKSFRGRPGMAAALADVEAGRAARLVVAKLDRATRSIVDAGTLLERAKKRGWVFVALDLGVDTSTAAGELVANVMASVAQWERRVISDRTKAALGAKKAQGARLGRPAQLDDEVVARIVRERQEGAGWSAIARALNADGVPTAHGGAQWHPSTVMAVLARCHRDAEAGYASSIGGPPAAVKAAQKRLQDAERLYRSTPA